VRAIEDWRYENRVPSRSEAVRRLIQIGLETSKGEDS
jgi:metal-responsive CopG/Arc/MetJ family transcriptional regulator